MDDSTADNLIGQAEHRLRLARSAHSIDEAERHTVAALRHMFATCTPAPTGQMATRCCQQES